MSRDVMSREIGRSQVQQRVGAEYNRLVPISLLSGYVALLQD